MISVSVRHDYPEATHFSSGEDGALRVYDGSEVIAEFPGGRNITVSQDAPVPADGEMKRGGF